MKPAFVLIVCVSSAETAPQPSSTSARSNLPAYEQGWERIFGQNKDKRRDVN